MVKKTYLEMGYFEQRFKFVPQLRGHRDSVIKWYKKQKKGKYPKTKRLRKEMYAYLGKYKISKARKEHFIKCATRRYAFFDPILRLFSVRK